MGLIKFSRQSNSNTFPVSKSLTAAYWPMSRAGPLESTRFQCNSKPVIDGGCAPPTKSSGRLPTKYVSHQNDLCLPGIHDIVANRMIYNGSAEKCDLRVTPYAQCIKFGHVRYSTSLPDPVALSGHRSRICGTLRSAAKWHIMDDRPKFCQIWHYLALQENLLLRKTVA